MATLKYFEAMKSKSCVKYKHNNSDCGLAVGILV